jgi:uncharacterized spore protein YtfJ
MSQYGSIQPSGSGSAGSSSFSPTEFLNLKESIYNNIIVIKKQFHKLEKITKVIGTKNDNSELRTKM